MVIPADKLTEEQAREVLIEWEIRQRRREAIKVLTQAERYISGYLKSHRIKVSKDFEGEPLRLEVEVYTIPSSIMEEIREERASEKGGEVSEG